MQQIIQHLFRVNSLEEVPRERLEELVATYPSFGLGRYLLSRKLHTEDAGHFSEETQKTNLYFSNPFWLHWLLQNEEASTQKPVYFRAEPSSNLMAEETMVEDEQSWGMPEEAPDSGAVGQSDGTDWKTSQEEAGTYLQASHEETGTDWQTPHEEALPVAEAATEEVATVENEFPINQEAAVAGEPAISGDFFQEQLEEEIKPAHAAESSAPPSAAEALLQSLEEARGLRQTLVQMNENEVEAPVHSDQTALMEEQVSEQSIVPTEAGLEEDASGGIVSIAESRVEEAAIEESPILAAATDRENGQEHPAGQPAVHTLESSVEAAVSSAALTAQAIIPPTEPIVVFEPYHTIDYFASVGIKLMQEDNPSDKLGKQLKSFTDWLKVMRKLPQKNQEIVPDVAVEHQIQAIAAHSITGKDILTETMAEVLVKQGMREKAIDVYHKLSLLNPEKSAYFATKIEQLKID